MNSEILRDALDCLKEVTPLKTDCGLFCEAACCKDNGEAGSCVWLLPGEDADQVSTWAEVRESTMPVTGAKTQAIYCFKPCNRDARPFLCRIFPLTPYFSQKNQCWSVRMDKRAAALCPLYFYGKNGLRRDFVVKAQEAVQILAQDVDGLAALKLLEIEESAYRIEL